MDSLQMKAVTVVVLRSIRLGEVPSPNMRNIEITPPPSRLLPASPVSELLAGKKRDV